MKQFRPVTFILPGDGRSGGVRVTVIMANQLANRGYPVRIAVPKSGRTPTRVVLDLWARFRAGGTRTSGWLHEFGGPIERYDQPDDLAFQPGEIVIAVGTYTVAQVRAIHSPVIKVRYNHGFPAQPSPVDLDAWKGSMPTITVSETLVPRLRELTDGNVWGVVPNGIDTSQYFVESTQDRDGIGAVLNSHSNKAPEDLIAVLEESSKRWPTVPQRVFSTELCPSSLRHTEYTRLPSVDEARRIYNRSKVWLLTSITEGLPGVVLEAMACGCVVVSSDNDGSLEVLRHEENGLVVPRRDRAAFMHQISRVLEDETLRTRLSAGAVKTVDRFTWKRAADRMEEFLAHVAESSKRNVQRH